MFVVALDAAVAAEPFLEASGSAVESAWVGMLVVGSSERAALLRSAADVESRAAKLKNTRYMYSWRTSE